MTSTETESVLPVFMAIMAFAWFVTGFLAILSGDINIGIGLWVASIACLIFYVLIKASGLWG